MMQGIEADLDVLGELDAVLAAIRTPAPLRAPLIALEGVPGAGKTTLIHRVRTALDNQGRAVSIVRFPTGTGVSRLFRSLMTQREAFGLVSSAVPWLLPLLLSADMRADLMRRAYGRGDILLMCRGYLSTLCYHRNAFIRAGLDGVAAWSAVEKACSPFPEPTQIVFLDVPPDIAWERIERQSDPVRLPMSRDDMEREHALWTEAADRLSVRIPILRIDATAAPDVVERAFLEACVVSDILRSGGDVLEPRH